MQTLDWHVMQDPKEPTKFCIVERYEQESSQQYHLNNPVSLVAFQPGRGQCMKLGRMRVAGKEMGPFKYCALRER
jgi:quinol monooxygenase YgiN